MIVGEVDKSYSIEQFHAQMLEKLFILQEKAILDPGSYKAIFNSQVLSYIAYLQSITGDFSIKPERLVPKLDSPDIFYVIGYYHRNIGLLPSRMYISASSIYSKLKNIIKDEPK